MPPKLERCVKQLLADPDFKPRKKGQSKRDAAYAVCTESLKKDRKSIPMRITKATIRDGGMYWQGVISDDDWDAEDERLSLDIFHDFKYRLDTQRQKADYQPPFISLSHYSRMDDDSGMQGTVEDVWTHGGAFKAEGWFADTPLAKWNFGIVKSELERLSAGEKIDDPIRFSVGFIPSRVAWEDDRKVYLSGELDHVALTRVPINPRTGFTHAMETKSMTKTRKDDALSIVGEDAPDDVLAAIDELEEKQRTQKADVDDLVIKADEDPAFEEHENQEIILRAMLKDEGCDDDTINKAQWDYSYKKDLPNSAYAWVEKGAGCEKKDGKTPQKCRHLPYKDKSGKIDCPHTRAALQAIGGARSGKEMSPPGGTVQKLRRALKGCQKSKAEILDVDLDEYEQGRVDGFNAALDMDIPDEEVQEIMTDETKTEETEVTEKKSGIDVDAVIEEFKPEIAEEKAEVEEADPIDYHVDLLKQLVVAEGYGREKKYEAGQHILRSLAAHVQAGIDESTPASPEDVAKSVVAQLDEALKPVRDEIAVIKAQLTGQTRSDAPSSKALSFDTSPTAPVEKSGEPFNIDPLSTLMAAQGRGGSEKSQIRDLARATTGLPIDEPL